VRSSRDGFRARTLQRALVAGSGPSGIDRRSLDVGSVLSVYGTTWRSKQKKNGPAYGVVSPGGASSSALSGGESSHIGAAVGGRDDDDSGYSLQSHPYFCRAGCCVFQFVSVPFHRFLRARAGTAPLPVPPASDFRSMRSRQGCSPWGALNRFDAGHGCHAAADAVQPPPRAPRGQLRPETARRRKTISRLPNNSIPAARAGSTAYGSETAELITYRG